MHDVIVVGARCAGAPAAMLLGRKGYKVLLVDRATFPSDIPYGHFIHRHGPRRLAAGDSWTASSPTNCPPVTSNRPGSWRFSACRTAWSSTASRSAMDRGERAGQRARHAAVEAGVELRQGFTVEDFITDGDRVTGIRGKTSGGGADHRITAVVVGADGRHSRLAASSRAPEYDARPTAACWYFSYWSGAQRSASRSTSAATPPSSCSRPTMD